MLNTHLQQLADDIDLEAIAFQKNSKMVKELSSEFMHFKNADNLNAKMVEESGIAKIIKRYTNITIQLKFEKGIMNAWVPFTSMAITKSNPLHAVYQNPYTVDSTGKALLRNKGFVDVQVDLLNARVGDGIGAIKHQIFMGELVLDDEGGFDVEQSMAIFLHEFGHIFTYYIALSATASTNFLISDLVSELLGTSDTKTRLLLLQSTKDELGLKDLDPEILSEVEDREKLQVMLYTSSIAGVRSEIGANPFDVRGCEALADQFATRFGLGRALASAIVLLNEGAPEDGGTAHNIGLLLVGIVITAGLFMGGIVAAYSGAVLAWLGILQFGVNHNVKVYDDVFNRVNAIRNQVKIQLRVEGTNKRDAREILDSLDAISKDLETLPTTRTLFEIFQSHLIPWFRGGYSSVLTQRTLENIAHSELDVAATRLEQLV